MTDELNNAQNSSVINLQEEPEVGRDMFRKHLKTFLFARY